MAYDRGDFGTAESLANELIAKNPNNEDAAILLGYVWLSKAGVDPYALARKLVAMSSTTTAAALTDSSSNASTTLATLATLINLSPDDFNSLSQKPFDNDGGGTTLFGSDN